VFIPGISPEPAPGETWDFPGIGPATVRRVTNSRDGTTTIDTDNGVYEYDRYDPAPKRPR
jgi:hypothetical protein